MLLVYDLLWHLSRHTLAEDKIIKISIQASQHQKYLKNVILSKQMHSLKTDDINKKHSFKKK